MEYFRDRKDAAGNVLLTEETWKVHANQKRLVVDLQGLAGCMSCRCFIVALQCLYLPSCPPDQCTGGQHAFVGRALVKLHGVR